MCLRHDVLFWNFYEINFMSHDHVDIEIIKLTFKNYLKSYKGGKAGREKGGKKTKKIVF